MANEREPTQAMPSGEEKEKRPRPTQPTSGHPRKPPKDEGDDGFGGFMGHGGQSDITYEGPEDEDGETPNAAAKPE
jgi:hypothetical protein